MRCLYFLYLAPFIASAATLTISFPPYLADCPNSPAVATLNWSGATAPVQIRVLSATGPAMTAFANPSGTATTGDWVTNGMPFFLVDATGAVQATATANFNCGGTPRTVDQGLAAASYFPLAVGNTWVYRQNSRFATNSYVVWSITGTQQANGQTYFVLSETVPPPAETDTGQIALLRSDSTGAIYQSTATGDQLLINPGTSTTTYAGPLGTFNNAITAPGIYDVGGEFSNSTMYVRGLGMVFTTAGLEEGSNGGFWESLELVDVRVDGVHLSIPVPKVTLGIETADLDLTDQIVPNCAVPCYFAACYIAPVPVDPPGAYRPCAQIRVESNGGSAVETQLINANNTAVYQTTTALTQSTNVVYLSMPLYTSPAATSSQLTFFPPGNYTLLGTVLDGTTPVATASIPVRIR